MFGLLIGTRSIIPCAGALLFVAACANAATGPARGAGDIAFTSNQGGQYDVYLMKADGSGVTKVTGSATPCAWSPDGTRIAFQSDRDASTAPDLYVMNADGTGVVRLTSRPGYESECSWSPDGSTLVFTSGDNLGRSEIYTIRADGTDERQLTNGGLVTRPVGSRDPAWSPDGTKIAFNASRQYFGVNDGGIYVMNADGSNQVRLSGSQTYATDNPTWSPDGAMIAFAAHADTSTDMFVVNADGSGERRLASLPGYEFFPSWSPAGARIAFASLRRDRSAYELYAINVDGTGLTLLDVGVWPERPPAWSPDGTRIAFMSYPDQTSDIYTVRSDGTGLTRLTNSAAADRAPLWRPAMGKD